MDFHRNGCERRYDRQKHGSRSATGFPIPRLNPVFSAPRKKRPSHSPSGRVSGVRWSKLSGEKCLDLKAFGGLLASGFPPVFWQTRRELGLFSTGNKRVHFSGFSSIGPGKKMANGTRFGRIFSRRLYPQIPGLSYEKIPGARREYENFVHISWKWNMTLILPGMSLKSL